MAALREQDSQRGQRLAERENLALQERTVLLEKLGALLQTVVLIRKRALDTAARPTQFPCKDAVPLVIGVAPKSGLRAARHNR